MGQAGLEWGSGHGKGTQPGVGGWLIPGPGEGGSRVYRRALKEGGTGYWRQGSPPPHFCQRPAKFPRQKFWASFLQGIQASAFNPSD